MEHSCYHPSQEEKSLENKCFVHPIMSKQIIWKSKEWRRVVLSLYKNILREHQYKLTPEQRYLGDQYVRNEFKLNKKANEEQVIIFL